MPRPATGQIVERRGTDGRIYRSLRFRAYGKRYTHPLGVISREKAAKALQHTMADVERGSWTPPVAVEAPPEPTPVPCFHEFAEEWWTRHVGQIREGTQVDYKGRLERHLIPWFGEIPLDQITFDTIERYIASRLAAAPPMSPRYVNMTVTLLSAILERAVKRKLIEHNPAADKDLRVKEDKRPKSYLDSAAQIAALLDAARELDRQAPDGRKHVERRAMIATLIFAGPRIEEMLGLRWRDVDLAGGWLNIRGTKTDQADRKVKIRGALRDELVALRGRHQDAPQTSYVFPTSTGRKLGPDNFRNRVLGRAASIKDGTEQAGSGAVARADKWLEAANLPPLPDRITPQSMRRTFASILYALGCTPVEVMQEMGHGDPALALKVYAQAMRRSDDEKAKLRALVDGADWANMGERAQHEERAAVERRDAVDEQPDQTRSRERDQDRNGTAFHGHQE